MDDSNRHLSEKEILEITEKSKHKTFGDLGLNEFNKLNKGGLGGFIEENVFKYKANSDANPDFIDAGIELKVTPIKKNNNGTYSSKERLVLNMINFCEEANVTFETSSFYKKNKRLLIWFYEHIKGKNPSSFEITDYKLYEFEKSVEYQVIKRDWEIIHNKIVAGKAHEISESDTEFLAACTKGADSSVLTNQPFSEIKCKPRAYSFKQSFMTRMYRNIIHEIAPYVSFISEDEWMKNPIEEVYKNKLIAYRGMSVRDLTHRFHVKPKAKDYVFKIAQKMLGLEGKKSSTLEMLDAGIKLKTVRLRNNGTPYESMSFLYFDFKELITTKWEESEIREEFVDWKLMFFVFKDNDKGISIFEGVKFWNIPNSIVDGEIKHMYEEAASLVKEGNALYFDDKGKIKDKFAKEKRNSNGVCHIRPHGRVKGDVIDLPTPDKVTGLTHYTKQCFWFNKLFIKKILEE